MQLTNTGGHSTSIIVEPITGLPVETPWTSITFEWTGDTVTSKKYYLNETLVRTDTYTYEGTKLVSIEKEVF